MKKIIFTLLLVSVTSNAGMEEGIYAGKKNGQKCSVEVKSIYFENSLRHPLNERIKVIVENESFTLGHPPVISPKDSIAFFNHDELSGITAISDGAHALVVEMENSATKEGPKQFTMIQHNWKTKSKQSWICKDLVLE